ncbi:MAG: response regulator transcription factor [Chloroflexi bacterium]|nr:response regulator transcription factor [Chloroflexota bacterium]
MEPDSRLRILIVDDHDIVRRGLVSVLSRNEHFLVVGEAGTAAEAVQKTQELSPDVVVLDVRLPDASGVEACREIRDHNPNVKVLMLTSYSDEEAVIGSIMAGASGYLLKEIRSQELLNAIERVGAGQSLLDPGVTARVLEQVRGPRAEDARWAQLLPQERQIVELIADGKTNKEIAEDVHLSDKTVKNYVSSILGKLEMARRSQAAAFVAERRAKRRNPP